MRDIPGKFVGLIVAFFLCVIAPLLNIVSQQEMLTRRQIITEMTNFVDEVVDARAYYPTMRKELITRLNSYGAIVQFKVIKEQRAVDATVIASESGTDSTEGSAKVSYITIPLDELGETDVVHFSTGDRIGIECQSIAFTGTQYVAHAIASLFTPKFDYRFFARIR